MFCKSQCFLPCKKRLCHFTVALGYVVSHSSGGILWTGFVAHSKRWSKQLQGCFLFSSGKPINCPDVTIFKLWDISTSDFEISSNASRCGFINENSLRAPAYWAEPSELFLFYAPLLPILQRSPLRNSRNYLKSLFHPESVKTRKIKKSEFFFEPVMIAPTATSFQLAIKQSHMNRIFTCFAIRHLSFMCFRFWFAHETILFTHFWKGNYQIFKP